MPVLWYFRDMTDFRQTIPSFSLFGEDVAEEFTEFFHWETIETRSAGYRWEIAPHRHPGLFQVLFLQSGTAEILLGQAHRKLEASGMVFVPPGLSHGFRFSHQADGMVVTGRAGFLRMQAASDPLRQALLVPGMAVPQEAEMERLAALAAQLLACEGVATDANRTAMRAAMAEAWLRLAVDARQSAWNRGNALGLADRFKALVEQHSRQHWNMGDYARELGCTTRTLSRTTAQALGMSPLEYVNRRLAADARRLLNFSNANVSQIAEELGFDDPSYFSRFYQRMTGRRPSAERQRGQLEENPET